MNRSDIDRRIKNLAHFTEIRILEIKIETALSQARIEGRELNHETRHLQQVLLELKRLRSRFEPLNTVGRNRTDEHI